jgi:hypothetical protein
VLVESGARGPRICLNVGMRRKGSGLVIAAALLMVLPAHAYSGRWLVVENVDTGTCYRMTAMPGGANWRRLAVFNTFRQAGRWTWEHRGGVCRNSPVFS